jgi:thiol-disulfide isomerase/thioredoxin
MVSLQAAVLALAMSGAGETGAGTGETVLLDFYADWCGPCRQMDGAVKKLAARGYPVRKVNVDQDRPRAERYRVKSVPCFVLLVDGREVSRTEGAVPTADLERMFRQAGVAPVTVGLRRARAQSPDPTGPGQGVHEQGGPAERRTFPSVESAQPLVDVVASGGDAGAAKAFADPAPHGALANESRSDPPAGPRNLVRPRGGRDALTARLLAASVRLKVDDGGGHSVGSGTVIDARQGEALVLTCGHLFRDSQGKGPIEIDLFGPGAPQGLPAKLISYDLQSDVALVRFRPSVGVAAIRVAPLNHNVRTKDSVINIGCNHGDSPTLRASRVTAINKFLGPPHLIVAGQPVQGRSGGGLFTNDGLLIGVCNAADPADDEGMYAALGAIHAELDRMGLAEMCLEEADPASGNVPLATREPPPMADQMPAPHSQPSPATLLPTSDGASAATIGASGDERLTATEAAALAEIRSRSEGAEVICIVRPLADPRAKSEIIVLDRASPEFLRQLSDERRVNSARHVTSDRVRTEPSMGRVARTTQTRPVSTASKGSRVRGAEGIPQRR